MSMSITEQGIDWDRIRPEHFAEVAAVVTEGSKGCDWTRGPGRWFGDAHKPYEALDGTTRCGQCALETLRREASLRAGAVRVALDEALGASLRDKFAAHIRAGG